MRLAVVAELLAGALSGGPTIQPGNARMGGIINNMFAVLVDPARLAGVDWLRREIDGFVDYVKASPAADPAAPVLVPGDPERAGARRALCATASTWTPLPGRSCWRRARRWGSRARSPPPSSPDVSPTPAEPDELPLAGYTVLDLTRVLAGPYCTRLLGDLGARVIKIERPGDGDETRRNYLQLEPGRADQSSYFHRVNAGKESVAVDMARPEGGRSSTISCGRPTSSWRTSCRGGGPARLRRADPAGAQDPTSSTAPSPASARRDPGALDPPSPTSSTRSPASCTWSKATRRPRAPRTSRPPTCSPAPMRRARSWALIRRGRTGRGAHLDVSMLEALVAADSVTYAAVAQRRARSTATRARAWWWPPSGTGAWPCSSWARPSSGPRLLGLMGRPELDQRSALRQHGEAAGELAGAARDRDRVAPDLSQRGGGAHRARGGAHSLCAACCGRPR